MVLIVQIGEDSFVFFPYRDSQLPVPIVVQDAVICAVANERVALHDTRLCPVIASAIRGPEGCCPCRALGEIEGSVCLRCPYFANADCEESNGKKE